MSAATIPAETAQQQRTRLFFLYHELRAGGSDYSYVVSEELFERHLGLYAQVRAANQGLLFPEITFDDGHISNHEIAAPLLESHGMTAHFFITVGWTGVKPGYMDWPDLRALHQAGHIIGAHGWSHQLLTHCSDQELETELVQPRLLLEDKLGAAITAMSLPGGRANAHVFAACRKAGYNHVFTSVPKPEAMPFGPTTGRFNVLGEMQPDWLVKVMDPTSSVLASLERKQRIKDAAKSLLGDRLYARVWAMVNRHAPEDSAA